MEVPLEKEKQMKAVTVFHKTTCPYCRRVLEFFNSENIPFKDVDLTDKPDELAALKERTGMRTVPQVFFDEELIGGCDDVMALHETGKLRSKLG